MATGGDLRALMRRFPGGVAVVTIDLDGERLGLTVGSLVSLSLDPPLVGISISKDAALHELLRGGGRWHDRGQQDMMGMSSREWSRYMHDELGLEESPEEINAEVVRRLECVYRKELPLVPGARVAVERLAAAWPLGLASSSNRPVI